MKYFFKYCLLFSLLAVYSNGNEETFSDERGRKAQSLQCWEYDPAEFVGWGSWAAPGKQHAPADELKPISRVHIAVAGRIEKDQPITLTTKIAGRLYRHSYIYSHEKKDGIYLCGGECDSGQLQLSEDMKLRLKVLSFRKSDDMGEPITELQLKTREESKWVEGKRVACPESAFGNLKGLYVCYTQREGKKNPTYTGCHRSRKSCESIGEKHFGHYPDEYGAFKAFYRCWDSKPRL